MNYFAKLLCVATSLFTFTYAQASEIEQIAGRDTLGNVGFTNLAMNSAGDFVAVSRTKIFVGNAGNSTYEEVFSDSSVGFSISDGRSTSVGTERSRLDFEYIGTKLAINDNGEFIVASNTQIRLGKIGTSEIRKVADGGRFTDFQSVAINNAGHYAAISYRSVFGGHFNDAAAQNLITVERGTFSVYGLSGYSGNYDVEAGETHLALNEAGKFVASSSRAVYVGNLSNGNTELVLFNDRLGTRHVAINESGQFVVIGYLGMHRGLVD